MEFLYRFIVQEFMDCNMDLHMHVYKFQLSNYRFDVCVYHLKQEFTVKQNHVIRKILLINLLHMILYHFGFCSLIFHRLHKITLLTFQKSNTELEVLIRNWLAIFVIKAATVNVRLSTFAVPLGPNVRDVAAIMVPIIEK